MNGLCPVKHRMMWGNAPAQSGAWEPRHTEEAAR